MAGSLHAYVIMGAHHDIIPIEITSNVDAVQDANRQGCFICGQELVYAREASQRLCVLCGQEFNTHIHCPAGHFVCDRCHRIDAVDWIEHACLNSKAEDPIQLATELMRSAWVNVHGPEHHFLVPAVMLTAVYNRTHVPELIPTAIKQARRRAAEVPGGFCGYQGACGGAIGAGIFMSIYTGATPLSQNEFVHSNRLTSQCLLEIAEIGGPRCCKRSTYLSLEIAARYLEKYFSIELPLAKPVKCTFFEDNLECLLDTCPYYKPL